MKQKTKFQTWLTEQGLDQNHDKEKRQAMHDYYRQNVYFKKYDKKRTGRSRLRASVTFTPDEHIQVRARATRAGVPVASYIKEATMLAVEGKQITGANTLSSVEQQLSLCLSDLQYVAEVETVPEEIYLDIQGRIKDIQNRLRFAFRSKDVNELSIFCSS